LVERYDTKKQYLRRLYAALRGRRDAVPEREALSAARAFSRFMSYKPVKSINGFVANEILEKKDLGDAIRTVSDLMKTIHRMDADATRLSDNIELLSVTNMHTQTYIEQWIEHQVLEYVTAKNRYVNDQSFYLKAKESQQILRKSLVSCEKERELAQERRQQAREQLIGMEAQRLGIDALQDKDKYEQQIASGKSALHQQALPLLDQDKALRGNIQACKSIFNIITQTSISTEITGLGERNLIKQARSVLEIDEQEAVDFKKLLGKDAFDLSPLEAHLDQSIENQSVLNNWRDRWFDAERESSGLSLRDQVSKLLDRRDQKLQSLRRQTQQKQSDVDSLNAKQVNYPHYTRAALEMIKRECPQADPQVLCDYVELKDPAWQSAVEGYIGGARFSIIVEENYEAEAARIVRNMPGRDNRARVIQGSKAKKDADRTSLPSNSVIHLMKFDHATARNYLQASYGSVEQVDSVDTLRMTRRGVSKEGVGSGSYALFRCDMSDAELVFGQGARERALAAKQKETELMDAQANEFQSSVMEAKRLLDAVNSMRHLVFAEQIQSMLETHYQITQAENGLENMDLSDFKGLEVEFDTLKEKSEALDQQIQLLDGDTGKLRQKIVDSEKHCKKLSELQEKTSTLADDKESNLRKIVSVWPEFDPEKCLIQADLDAETISLDILENKLKSIDSELNSKAYEIERHVSEHNQGCQPSDAIVYSPDYRQEHAVDFFRAVCHLQREVGRVHNTLKNNILVEKQEKLGQLKESFNNVFVTNLCHAIYQSINDGKRVLEDLNKELKHHRFGADQESYWFDWEWVPEYREYWNFFEEVIKNPSLGDGQTLFDSALSESSIKVRDQLMSMLLDDDEQKSMRELERLSDYRNYRSYEIYKQPANKEPIALSQYGTGSGGQLETPAYIIRSAAITSAFRFNEGDTHLRMVLVDEAFSKMDEARSKEVINYLTESLGLQLLFIMPTSKSGPFMDMISNQIVFSKVPLAEGKSKGELKTRVLVDRQECNQEKIKSLWANHRKVMRHQAGLDFMSDFS
jgi:hypothetical protein